MLAFLALAAFQELEPGVPGWTISTSGPVTVVSQGGSISFAGEVPTVTGARRFVTLREGELIDAQWDGRRLERRRSLTVRGALERVALMPPVGRIELEGTDGETELYVEVLDDPRSPATPEIDSAGRFRTGGPALILALVGKIRNGGQVEIEGGKVTVALRNIRSPGARFEMSTLGWIRLEDVTLGWLSARTTTEFVQANRLTALLAAELQSRDGSISAESLESPSVSLDSANGDVRVVGAAGDNLHAASSGGGVRLQGLRFTEVRAESTSGVVELVDSQAARLSLRTQSGAARASHVLFRGVGCGQLRVETISGAAEVQDSEGRFLVVRTATGNIRLVRVTAEDRSVRTVNGRVTEE